MNQNIIEKFTDLLGKEKVKVNEPMNRHTTFRIGGPADCFLLPSSQEELQTSSQALLSSFKNFTSGT